MIGLFFLLLLALWVGGGLWLLWRGSGKSSGNFQREVSPRICAVGETIDVTLQVSAPPADTSTQQIEDRDVVLAIDHSGSMGAGPGSSLREALRAAENFVRRLPAQIHVGIVSFDHEARLVCPISSESDPTLGAIAAIGPGGGTAIHLALDCCREALPQGRANVRKTVILLSDGGSNAEAATSAARRLQAEIPGVSIICVGFGPHVNEPLMQAIATANGYRKVANPDDLYDAFSYLATEVSGQTPSFARIDEGTWAPHPFRLSKTKGLYPIGVRSANPMRIIWSMPVINKAETLNYELTAECPGWHPVATADGHATWSLPDGTERKETIPNVPMALVLPWWMRWAWPIFNPLFWIIFGRFWRCQTTVKVPEQTSPPPPLPTPSFPTLLPPPQDRPYEAQARPALVVGLGEVGEWAVCRLKDRLQDRGIPSSQVDTLTVHVSHHSNRSPIKVGLTTISPDERIELNQDLRPYLESLRNNGSPPIRAWVPWRQWLGDMQPQTTPRRISDDRRKARLALLQKPDPVEQRLAPALARIIEQNEAGLVILTGSAHDAECSGLMAEIAHICAAKGAAVTAVFAPDLYDQAPPATVLAMAEEMERMLLMRGQNIVSDRHSPQVPAKRLFDRVIVCEQRQLTPSAASLPVAELIWAMLAYQEVFKQFPTTHSQDNEVICTGATLSGQSLPAGNLWRWVRERTLALGINRDWLGLRDEQGRLTLPKLDKNAVDNDVEAFWTGRDNTRPLSRLLAGSRGLLQTGSVTAVIGLQSELPVVLPYHEQVAYSENERRNFAGYLEEWCYRILDREQRKGSWGLPMLTAALLRVEQDCQTILGRVRSRSGLADFSETAGLATALYVDFLAIVGNLRDDLAQWIARFVGPQLELRAGQLPEAAQPTQPVSHEIEGTWQMAEEGISFHDVQSRDFFEARFDQWFNAEGESLLSQLRFIVCTDLTGQQIRVKLRLDDKTEMGSGENLLPAIRAALDRYRNLALTWPLDEMMRPANVPDPLSSFRVGKHSARVYPQVRRAVDEDDPFIAAAIQVRERPLKELLGVAAPIAGERPYAWPEEANAARIADKIRNRLNRNPEQFSPAVVHLLRDTQKLFGFLSDLAQGRVTSSGVGFILKRDGREYAIGPRPDRIQGLDAFQNVMQQVVAWESSVDGEPIGSPSSDWKVTPEEAVRAVEAHPLAQAAINSPEWRMWQDVIQGITLEHSG